jgi:hypothetical protein
MLNEIGSEPYGGDSSASKPKARKFTARKQPAATPSNLSWGNVPMPKQQTQGKLSFSKVNGTLPTSGKALSLSLCVPFCVCLLRDPVFPVYSSKKEAKGNTH